MQMKAAPFDSDLKLQQRLSKTHELEAEKSILLKNSTAKTFALPEIFHYDFSSNIRPWTNKKDADITDYFNYGFNEETWRLYVNKIKKLNLKLNPTEHLIEIQSIPESQKLNELEDKLPIDLGGFSTLFFKDLTEGIGENFFEDQILTHCEGRKKYGSPDYENIALDNFLNYFLNYPMKPLGKEIFEKLLKFINAKNVENSEDIYQVKKHLELKMKSQEKKTGPMPPMNPFMMRPPMPSHASFFPPMMPGQMMAPGQLLPPGQLMPPGFPPMGIMNLLDQNRLGMTFPRFEMKREEKKDEKKRDFDEKKIKYEKKERKARDSPVRAERRPQASTKKVEKLDDLSEYSRSRSRSRSEERPRERRKSPGNEKKHSHNVDSHWSRSFIPNYLHKKKPQESHKKKKRYENGSRSSRSKSKNDASIKEKRKSSSRSKSREKDRKKKLEEVKSKGVISLKAKNNDFKEKT